VENLQTETERFVLGKLENARKASFKLALLSTSEKNRMLLKMADELEKDAPTILAANAKDLEASDLKSSLKDRLMLNKERLKAIADDVRKVAELPDPIGESEEWTRPNGLKISKVRVPLGVVGTIYESRPNVTVDMAALCLKSGNAVVLRGSSSALNSNRALVRAIARTVPEGAVELLDIEDRTAVDVMMNARGLIDVLIPRGGPQLIQRVVMNSKVPVIETGAGNCHIFVDETADLEKAVPLIINAKCQRPGVCNAAEKLLVHEKIADKFLPVVCAELVKNGVELHVCERTAKALGSKVKHKLATPEDWGTEYLDLVMGVKVVKNISEAIEHINKYNTKHTEAILTENAANAERFAKEIDAAAVMINASTRFTDGSQFGFGAEIGISTQKMHARGPMGLKELTTCKYVVKGTGQIRK
jgi:glutamate-5-semialdehyde dehydrogenase